MRTSIKLIIASLIAVLSAIIPATATAAPISVNAKLDSAQILMGKMTLLRLEVVQNKNVKGEFRMFRSVGPDGIIGVCGDSVELRSSIKKDTTELGSGRIQINYSVPVQAFDSGFYQLPEFAYYAGKDSALSNRVSLKVVPIPGLTADDQISPYADVMGPAEEKILDAVPDVIVDYWWIILLIIIIIALTIFLIRRYRSKGSFLPKKPAPSPYVVALESLERLRNRKLWEQGMEREYFTELTDILRVYLSKRFGINAMEMTTRQIIEKLSQDERIRDKREYMRQVLDMADFVKFAAMRPIPDDNVKSMENAVRFVEETKPEEKPVDEKEEGFEIPADTSTKPLKKADSKKPAAKPVDKREEKGGEK